MPPVDPLDIERLWVVAREAIARWHAADSQAAAAESQAVGMGRMPAALAAAAKFRADASAAGREAGGCVDRWHRAYRRGAGTTPPMAMAAAVAKLREEAG